MTAGKLCEILQQHILYGVPYLSSEAAFAPLGVVITEKNMSECDSIGPHQRHFCGIPHS